MNEQYGQKYELRPLLDELAAGSDTAAAKLIEYSCERLRGLTRRMLKSCSGVKPMEDTDDILQGAMLRLHRALETVHPDSVKAFFGLAAVQVRRQLQDVFRRYKNKPDIVRDDGAEEDASGQLRQRLIRDKPDSSAGPSTLAEWTEFHQKVEQLPEEDREVFDLIYYQGLSQLDVANLLGVTDRTIKRRWRSAREKLYRLLKGEMPCRQ